MSIQIRNYKPDDYQHVKDLYNDPDTFGGQYDDARDTRERLDTLEITKPGSILVAEDSGKIIGTVTLLEDGRSAWLYRFAVQVENQAEITRLLYMAAVKELKQRGHTQVLVYAPASNKEFQERYLNLGLNKGSDYTAYWQDI